MKPGGAFGMACYNPYNGYDFVLLEENFADYTTHLIFGLRSNIFSSDGNLHELKTLT